MTALGGVARLRGREPTGSFPRPRATLPNCRQCCRRLAVLIGTDARRVMEIRRGKLDRFSLETLIRYLTRLGQRVELRISGDKR